MAKKYVVGYKVDNRKEVVKGKSKIVEKHGRFWEHAIASPELVYEIGSQDKDKAFAVARLLRRAKKRGKLIRTRFVEVV